MLLLRVVLDGMRSLGTHHFNRGTAYQNQINPTARIHTHTHTHLFRIFFNVRRNVVLLWTAILGMLSIRLGYYVYLHADNIMQKIHTKHLYRYAEPIGITHSETTSCPWSRLRNVGKKKLFERSRVGILGIISGGCFILVFFLWLFKLRVRGTLQHSVPVHRRRGKYKIQQ